MSSGRTSRRGLLGVAAMAALTRPLATAAAATVIKGTVIGKEGWLFLVWDDPRKADPERMRRVIKVITDTIALLKAANIQTVIALTPAKARVYREFLPDDFKFSPEADRRYGSAVEMLRRSGAPVVDLALAFAELRKTDPNQDLFFHSDTHWTSFGAENAAFRIGKDMLARLRPPPSGRPGARLGPDVKLMHTNSDLSAALPSAERLNYPSEAYQTRQAVTMQGRAALIEDDAADVVVIGNSYMQPKYNFAPALSSTLGRPVSLVWKNHLVGPYKILLNYLGGELFKHQRPKAIVWNFHEVDMELMTDNKDAWPQDSMTDEAFLAEVKHAVGA